MTGGFQAYLSRISYENRRQARKMIREVDREGLLFEVARNAEQTRLFFQQMTDLHRQRWTAAGKLGSFAPRHADFHSALAEILMPRGDAVLARLSRDGNPFAVVFGYRVHGKFHCYQQGVTQGTGRVRSAGTATWLLLMRHLADDGVTLFDHLKGKTTFKDRFGTGIFHMADLHITRPSLRLLTARAAHWVRRTAWKVARFLRQSPRGASTDVSRSLGGAEARARHS
jgi:CelD/BcsL family acetyltransferase involved in cellulose biosynthesis